MRYCSVRSILFAPVLLLACAHDKPPASSPEEHATSSGDPVQDVQPTDDPPSPADPNVPARPELTTQECEGRGGEVIGDIGDGAIYQTAYMCPSGSPPIGNITAPAEGPTAVEGAVCCL